MARLTRVHQKVFASNASNNGVFGSLQAGNPTTSNDVATLQSLAAFENGWDSAAYSGDKLPPLEEFQGIQYGISYQQAYMLQEGIAEWDATTPYYKGSLVKTISGTSFKLYCSLADNNTGNIVTNTTYWGKVMDSDDVYAFDSTVVHLSGTETISGNKTFTGTNTFSGTVSLGSSATATTQSASNNSTKVATTAFVKDVLGSSGNGLATISKSQNGYCKFECGLIIQWGYAAGSGTVTLPIPFSDANYGVCLTRSAANGTNDNDAITTTRATSFDVTIYQGGGGHWIAIGY